MSCRGLPDSEHHAHPRLTWLIQMAFDLILTGLFRIEHDVPADFRLPPGSVLISNHLRDSDGPVLARIMVARHGLGFRRPLPFFAMREDLYQREALANLLPNCPRFVARTLALMRLHWLFDNGRARPLRRTREFSWHDTLRLLHEAGLDDADPADVLNRRGRDELLDLLGHLPPRVSAINPWRLGRRRVLPWGLRRLTVATLRQVAPCFKATVRQQLAFFADRLNAGHALYLAPEGKVSTDGCSGPIRTGLFRLADLAERPPVVVPVTLSYDPLIRGRTRVIARLGQPIDMRYTRTNASAVRQALSRGRVVTPSHLLAHYLTTRRGAFTTRTLATWLAARVTLAHDSGIALDPVFDRQDNERLVADRLQWLARNRILTHRHGQWHHAADTTPLTTTMARLANALMEMAPELTAGTGP